MGNGARPAQSTSRRCDDDRCTCLEDVVVGQTHHDVRMAFVRVEAKWLMNANRTACRRYVFIHICQLPQGLTLQSYAHNSERRTTLAITRFRTLP